MGVIRLVVLAVLVYIAWMLLRAILAGSKAKEVEREAGADRDERKVEDTLVEDPVCHRLVPKHEAVRMRKDGRTHYFCSDECCDKFTDTPGGKE